MTDLRNIKNIVFDLGVVLFDIDFELTFSAFAKLGVHNHEELFSEDSQIVLFDKFERGDIQVPEFLKEMQNLVPANVDEHTIIEAWNAMLIRFPQSNIDLLKGLRSRYDLYLLSNTNELHIKRIHEIIAADHGLEGFEEFFSAVYYSYKVGLRKPDLTFYTMLMEKEKLIPTETVFIDDVKRNVESAEEMGIRGILLEKGVSVTELFDSAFALRV